MAYTITGADGSVVATISDGTTDTTSTPLTLVGKNSTNYGLHLNTNMVSLLNNFSSSTNPTNAIIGQMWFDSGNNRLKYLDTGRNWRITPNLVVSGTQPTNQQQGDFWLDSTDNVLKVYSGSAYSSMGLGSSSAGSVVAKTINDSTGSAKAIMEFIASNKTMFIMTSENQFTPSSTATQADGTLYTANFPIIKPGINLRQDTTMNPRYWGIASSSEYADLAERYEADANYEPGTVMMLGGTKEVTQTTAKGQLNVIGVVSTAPAYLMNSEAGTDATHPQIAMMGRIPCKVVGKINKFDVMVTSDTPGVATSISGLMTREVYTKYGNQFDSRVKIGFAKALESYDSTSVGSIEVMIMRSF